MARFDSDAIQRFEAAIAFAPAMPLTFDVDQHAGLLARFVRQTAARVFPEGDGSQKEGLDFGRHVETHPCEKPILMEQRKARAWQDLCCLWKAWVVWTDPSAAVSRLTGSVVFYCGQCEGGRCTEAKTG